MDEMKIAYRGLSQTLGDAIRPALLPHLEHLTEWTCVHQPQIRTSIEAMVKSIVDGFAKLGAAFDFIGDHWRKIAAVAGGVGVYIAGPAVLGAVTTIGPALFALVSPMTAVRLGILGIQLALNPLGSATRVISLILAGLTAYVIATPGALKALQDAFTYVGEVASRVGDVFTKAVAPAIGGVLTAAFERLSPYLPTTAQLFAMIDIAGRMLEGQMARLADFIVGKVVPAFDAGLRVAVGAVRPAMALLGEACLTTLDVMSGVANWIIGPGYDAVANGFSRAWAVLKSSVEYVRPAVEATWAGLSAAADWIVATAVPAVGGFFVNAGSRCCPC